MALALLVAGDAWAEMFNGTGNFTTAYVLGALTLVLAGTWTLVPYSYSVSFTAAGSPERWYEVLVNPAYGPQYNPKVEQAVLLNEEGTRFLIGYRNATWVEFRALERRPPEASSSEAPAARLTTAMTLAPEGAGTRIGMSMRQRIPLASWPFVLAQTPQLKRETIANLERAAALVNTEA